MKLCLVSNEILGAHRNGGIGTATSHLAMLLARHGHSVTLFYVGAAALDPLSPWASHYQAAGIVVWHHPDSPAQIEPQWLRQTVEIYDQLQDRNFDVILFQDWLALGHSCMIAKSTGLAFANTTLAIVAHSNSSWISEANHAFPTGLPDLALAHMEQQAIELADSVVSPSHYLTNWMRDAGWTLPDSTSIIPYFLEGAELSREAVRSAGEAGRSAGEAGRSAGEAGRSADETGRSADETGRSADEAWQRSERPRHLVFFGRLERRKGIDIFLSALVSEELQPFQFKVTFLGRPATRSIEHISGFIATHRPDLMAGLSFEPDLSSDEAQALLAATGCIPVIPSLIDNSPCVVYECLKLGLPFIAAASGGTPELIDAADRDRCLFAPNRRALARKLRDVLSSDGRHVPRPAYDPREIGGRWLAWFEAQTPKSPPVASPYVASGPADTTVIVTHHERPRLVEQNLRALAMQTDSRFQVILVDDGSESEAALAFLDRAGRGIGGMPVKVVRQGNNYVGAARNTGIRHAGSRFLIFLDDDNIAFPNMVEVFRHAALHSGADIVSCQMQFFEDPTGDPDPWNLVTGEKWAFSGGPVALGAVRNCFGDTTAIYKRELFERIGYFHELFGVTHEDWQVHLRACMEGLMLLSLPLALFWYRATSGSVIRSTDPYDNMSVVASTFREKLPRSLWPIIDLMIGVHYPG
jgi:glycosyltransferase involved in cell wall biosynthesis/GT2 family glycosyltransferase